jgi:hypothetical protein
MGSVTLREVKNPKDENPPKGLRSPVGRGFGFQPGHGLLRLAPGEIQMEVQDLLYPGRMQILIVLDSFYFRRY